MLRSKLKLNKTTIRVLNRRDLADVFGGTGFTQTFFGCGQLTLDGCASDSATASWHGGSS